MKAQSKALRVIIFTILMALLAMPAIQNLFKPFKVHPLHGAITEPTDAKLTASQWFSGNYQKQKEEYINGSFGLRNIFVRINNEIEFDLFKHPFANGVIIGKQNYLYEEDYIKAYYGDDYIGTDSINRMMHRIKFIQDTLAKLNKTLIIVFAPSKGSFYPEYFPDRFIKPIKTTNYQTLIKKTDDLGINHIDFDKYFLAIKQKSKYQLFTKYGIHWSFYGECLAADSIISFVAKIRNINMPHIYWKKITMNYPMVRDADVEDGMNLLFNLKTEKLAYPFILFQSDSGKTKPSALVVSDSFFWGMFSFNVFNVFSNSHFWYYNQSVYPDDSKQGLTVDKIDLREQLAKTDVIILMASWPKLNNLGWGFVENTYNLFTGTGKGTPRFDSIHRAKRSAIIQAIKASPAWLSQVTKGAKESHIPLDSALILNAEWYMEQKK